MKLKEIMIFILFSLFTISLSAQSSLMWTKVYGGTGEDYGYDIQKTTDGGYIIVGCTNSFGSGDYDVWLLKLDSFGDTLWTKTFGDSVFNKAYSVKQTYDGGYIMTGETYAEYPDYSDVYLIKTDSFGNSIWIKKHKRELNCNEIGHSVIQTSDSGYIIVGEFHYGNACAYYFKTNSNGDTLWTRIYFDVTRAYHIQKTFDKGYIIGISSPSFINQSLIKIDSIGDTLWTGAYGTVNNYSTIQTVDSGFIFLGDSFLVKTNSTGAQLWTKPYTGKAIQQTTDNSYIIAGVDESIFIMKTNQNGDSLWTEHYDGSGVGSILTTSDGGYIICGSTTNFGAGGSDIYIIKTDSLGNTVYVEEEQPEIPNIISFTANYSRNEIIFNLSLPMTDNIKLEIYDITGRLISIPISGIYRSGNYSENLTLERKGIYFYRLNTSNAQYSGKILAF